VWAEVRSLVRVTQIDKPEAVLISPDQAFFLRENIKLRLFNARLSLLSRQFDLAQADLTQVQSALNRYFDRNARPVQSALELSSVVVTQSRQVSLPRPDETLAALAAVAAGR
jgi:uroporphyrin-3 C-methyltransferase